MRRSTLILIIVLAVILIGGAVYLWMTNTMVTVPWATITNTSAANTNTTTNTAPKTVTLPTEVKGDTAVAGTLKIGTVDVTLNSQQKQATMDSVNADAGKTFLIVYFDTIPAANISAVEKGLRAATLSDGKTSYPLLGLKIASTYVKGDRGYLKFSVPTTATNLQLVLGTGATAQTVKLP